MPNERSSRRIHRQECTNFALEALGETIENHLSCDLDYKINKLKEFIESIETTKKVAEANAFSSNCSKNELDAEDFRRRMEKVCDGLKQVKLDLLDLAITVDDAAEKS